MEFLQGLHLYHLRDRVDAGQQLAVFLRKFKSSRNLILALPRGGVVVGYQIWKKLQIPFSVFLVRKIGHPNNPELGIGAIAENGEVYFDQEILRYSDLLPEDLKFSINSERNELKRRLKLYRKGRRLPNLTNKTIILVDDGIATGVTVFAAIQALRKLGAKKLVLAVPVCASDTTAKLEHLVDEFIYLIQVKHLGAIGNFYKKFDQVTDAEVVELLKKAV